MAFAWAISSKHTSFKNLAEQTSTAKHSLIKVFPVAQHHGRLNFGDAFCAALCEKHCQVAARLADGPSLASPMRCGSLLMVPMAHKHLVYAKLVNIHPMIVLGVCLG